MYAKLSQVPSDDRQFYKDHVSATVVSNNGTYVVTPGSWTKFQEVYQQYDQNYYIDGYGKVQNRMDDQFIQDVVQYIRDHPGTSQEVATTDILLKMF